MKEITKEISKRKTVSIYCDPLIWRSFRDKCRITGQSTCHILEAFMYAFTKALPDQPITSLPAVNVNLTVNRVVQRVHRTDKEPKIVYRSRSWHDSRMRVLHPDGSYD